MFVMYKLIDTDLRYSALKGTKPYCWFFNKQKVKKDFTQQERFMNYNSYLLKGVYHQSAIDDSGKADSETAEM